MRKYDPEKVGVRIKKQRELLGLSREKLAKKVDITSRYIYDIELGLKNGALDTLCRIAEVLDLPIDYMLFGENETDTDYLPITSLVRACPKKKLPHLEAIISEYLQAIK